MRVALSPRTVALAVAMAVAVVATWNVLVAARGILATAAAAAVLALLLSGPVEWLVQYMRRGLAVLVTLLVAASAFGLLTWAVFDELDGAFTRLETAAPNAARELERSEQFGDVARDLRLTERVGDAIRELQESTQERAQAAAFRAASYLIATVLTIFLLIYGSRMLEGGLAQMRNAERQARARHIVDSALMRGRRYLSGAIVQGLVVIGVSYGAFRLVGLPASLALAVVAALVSVVPYFGILVGFIPALLFSGAFEAGSTTVVLVLLAVALQVASAAATRYLSRRAMYAGPALTLFALLLGFDVYGAGGAIFGSALAVFVIAGVEAAAAELGYGDADATMP